MVAKRPPGAIARAGRREPGSRDWSRRSGARSGATRGAERIAIGAGSVSASSTSAVTTRAPSRSPWIARVRSWRSPLWVEVRGTWSVTRAFSSPAGVNAVWSSVGQIGSGQSRADLIEYSFPDLIGPP